MMKRPLADLLAQLVRAIEAETETYLSVSPRDNSPAANAACAAATLAVHAIKVELTALPATVEADPDFAIAMALVNKHALVMEAAYSSDDIGKRERVRLVDAVLRGTPYADVRWLWPESSVRQAA